MVGRINIYDEKYKYDFKGFTSIVNQIIVLAKIHFKKYGNYDVFVDDKQVLDLFENVYQFKKDDVVYELSPIFFEDYFSGKYDNEPNAHKIVQVNDLISRNPKNFIRLKEAYVNEFEELRKTIFDGHKVIGVQVRGTDKVSEIPKINETDVINKLKHALQSDERLTKIYVATDDIHYLNAIISEFGDEMVVYNDKNAISHNGLPLHKTYDKQKMNKEVMSDVYLLSKCDYVLYSFSNVSFLALSMMENHNKPLINLNT